MKVAFVASRTVSVRALTGRLSNLLGALPASTTILLRKGRHSNPGQFELIVSGLCEIQHVSYEWCVPEPGGREQTFERDIKMVERSGLVLAFFDEGQFMEGGTGHVVEKAVERGIHTIAYELRGDTLHHVGELEGERVVSQ